VAWIVPEKRKDGGTSYKVCWRAGGRQRSKTLKRSADAQRYKRHIEHQQDTGTYRAPNLGKVPFSKFFEHFMQTSPPDAPATRSLYAMHARLYLVPQLGVESLNSLSLPRIKAFLAELKEAGVGDPDDLRGDPVPPRRGPSDGNRRVPRRPGGDRDLRTERRLPARFRLGGKSSGIRSRSPRWSTGSCTMPRSSCSGATTTG